MVVAKKMSRRNQKKTTALPSRFSREERSLQSPVEGVSLRNHVESEELLDVRE